MPRYSIERTDFEKQKKELKKFAEQPATSTELDIFSTDGQWSDFWSGGIAGVLSGHKVTGEEMNSLVTELQMCFAEINERDQKVIKEFGQVYRTFEALDKGYIQGILIGVESAKEASREAKEAQKDIDDTIKALQITVNKLKQFKEEVNRNKHLSNVDEIWSDVQRIDGLLGDISERIGTQEPRIEELSTKIDEAIDEIQEHVNDLITYKDSLEKLEHITDIDDLWTDVNALKETTTGLSESFESKTKHLEDRLLDMKSFSKSQKHFDSVDDMWDRLRLSEKKLQESIESLKQFQSKIVYLDNIRSMAHINDVDDEWDYSHSLGEKIETLLGRTTDIDCIVGALKEKNDTFDKENTELWNKIKIVYLVAGGALGLSVLQLVLSIMGIF